MNITILKILALVGIVNILTRSFIFQPLREKLPPGQIRYFSECPQCIGFWVGFFGSPLVHLVSTSWDVGMLVNAVLVGGLVSVVSSCVIHTLDVIPFTRSYLIAKTNVLYPSLPMGNETQQQEESNES